MVCCQGEVFEWSDFENEWKWSKSLFMKLKEDTLFKQVLTSNRIHHIQEYSKQYKTFLDDHNILGLMYSPYLSYDISRNYSGKIPQELWDYLRFC